MEPVKGDVPLILACALLAVSALIAFTRGGRAAGNSLAYGCRELATVIAITSSGIMDSAAIGNWAGAIEMARLGIGAGARITWISIRAAGRNFFGTFADWWFQVRALGRLMRRKPVREFKDTRGRVWKLSINVTTIRRAREATKFDLASCLENRLAPLHELLRDPCRLVDVLFAIVSPKAPDQRVDWEDFAASMGGQSLADAAEAFAQELADFFPTKKAVIVRDLLKMSQQITDVAQARAMEELETFDADAVAEEVINSYGNPANPEQGSKP
jgi:hypothetical protein